MHYSIHPRSVTRREFIRKSATFAAGAAIARGMTGLTFAAQKRNKALPNPNKSGIEHFVVVMMENRSFDHLLGWLPGADGRQAGLAYADAAGVAHPTFPLAPDYQGCAFNGPDHTYAGGRIAFNGGACDGWLRVPGNDAYAIGY